jgi:hypothetical protein
MQSGFAAAHGGKAMPYRKSGLPDFEATPRIFRGGASNRTHRAFRKGRAFPPCAAAKPLSENAHGF